MMKNERDSRGFVQSVANCLVGKIAWGAALGHGSFLTMEFGEVRLRKDGTEGGEIHLWLYGCAWRIEKENRFLLGSQDDRKVIDKRISELLDGKQIESVYMNPQNFDTTFKFQSNLLIQTFSHSADMEHWLLYLPKDRVLGVGPGYTYNVAKGHL